VAVVRFVPEVNLRGATNVVPPERVSKAVGFNVPMPTLPDHVELVPVSVPVSVSPVSEIVPGNVTADGSERVTVPVEADAVI
jgi:hypothetical protein